MGGGLSIFNDTDRAVRIDMYLVRMNYSGMALHSCVVEPGQTQWLRCGRFWFYVKVADLATIKDGPVYETMKQLENLKYDSSASVLNYSHILDVLKPGASQEICADQNERDMQKAMQEARSSGICASGAIPRLYAKGQTLRVVRQRQDIIDCFALVPHTPTTTTTTSTTTSTPATTAAPQSARPQDEAVRKSSASFKDLPLSN
eukprot:gnl/Spiro4/27293_TR13585_c0_g1_i1.p1 gnl/Spiro4/27293_TR13585_c0_g1~~gnl/Spiro4/27293_TR13585_c0_g1_i1.p1  ORF type:complete len:213 (-),score=40.64 gnl/Spiro4/27293_TR13585_c0_g1_i1:85-693(-)